MFLSFVWNVVIISMLKRFNATALLERLRNKRLVFVGDSLNRGQWVSMVCLVDSIIPSSLKSMQSIANGSLNIFKIKVSFFERYIELFDYKLAMKHIHLSDKACPCVRHVLCPTLTRHRHIIILNYTIF